MSRPTTVAGLVCEHPDHEGSADAPGRWETSDGTVLCDTHERHDTAGCVIRHAATPHAEAACDLAARFDVPWALASWALQGGRHDHAELAAALLTERGVRMVGS